MTKLDIKSFYNTWTDCRHCKKILKVMDIETDENHDIEEFPIGTILKRCQLKNMSKDIFQLHLKHHLLWMKALKKVGRYRITLGKNYELYTRTTKLIELIKQIRPKNFEWMKESVDISDLEFPDLVETVKSIYIPIIDHGAKSVKSSKKGIRKKGE